MGTQGCEGHAPQLWGFRVGGAEAVTREASARHLPLIGWRGRVLARGEESGRAGFSPLPHPPSGMASANQADSSSEETSSSSDETYVEVIAAILGSRPLQTSNSRRGLAGASHTNGAKSVQQVFRGLGAGKAEAWGGEPGAARRTLGMREASGRRDAILSVRQGKASWEGWHWSRALTHRGLTRKGCGGEDQQ